MDYGRPSGPLPGPGEVKMPDWDIDDDWDIEIRGGEAWYLTQARHPGSDPVKSRLDVESGVRFF